MCSCGGTSQGKDNNPHNFSCKQNILSEIAKPMPFIIEPEVTFPSLFQCSFAFLFPLMELTMHTPYQCECVLHPPTMCATE